MTRYWALRTDPQRRPFFWSELQAGRLRQGWGYAPELNLELLADIRRRGGRFEVHQQDAWRGNRRLLPSQPDSMQVGDIVVFLNLPRHGVWSIARVTGGYRYEISKQGNAVDGAPDYGHIRDVDLLTRDRAIDPIRDGVSEPLRLSMHPISRMWSIDPHRQEIERLVQESS